MRFLRLLQRFSIPYEEQTAGWLQLKCPWCSDPSKHLGFHLDSEHFNCWRCGWHPVRETLSRITRIAEPAIDQLVQEFGGWSEKGRRGIVEDVVDVRTGGNRKPHKLPFDCGPLLGNHRRYLVKRGFDPDQLQEKWGLMGTGPTASLDGISYKHRLLIPIQWQGRRVSFQTRDVTGKATARYLSCPQPRELQPYKSTLYGLENEWEDEAVCVEGPTDVWRLGSRAFATFGTQVTKQQVREMVRRFRRIIVAFDPEPEATMHARDLISELRLRGVRASGVVPPEGVDPGDMSDSQARRFLHSAFKNH